MVSKKGEILRKIKELTSVNINDILRYMSIEKRKLNRLCESDKEQLEYEDTLDPIYWSIYKSAVDEPKYETQYFASNRREKTLKRAPVASESTSECIHDKGIVIIDDLDPKTNSTVPTPRCKECGEIVECMHFNTSETMYALYNKQDDLVPAEQCEDCHKIIKIYET